MDPDNSQPPLTLPPDQMRRLGHQVVDLVVDALAGLRARPPARRPGLRSWPVCWASRCPGPGGDPEVVLRQAVTDVLGPAMRVDHPRFFAYAPIPSNYRRVADAMLVDELATLSSIVLDGRTTLRLCTVNPRATREDVEATLARVEELAATV